jgi:glycosyltransferase involved in cell wall biosynthesis
MRVGKNPYKHKSGKFTPATVGIVSLVYIPFLNGYFEHSLEVLRVHLESLLLTKTGKSNLLVFDNGSCEEVTDYLQGEHKRGLIDWLVLSNHNMSKVGAINWTFSVLENQYLAFTDSDVLFRPGWLEKCLELFKQFDKAGIVGAQPPFYDLLKEDFLSPELIRQDENYQVDEMIPDQRWVMEYCSGLGLPEEECNYYKTKPLLRVMPQSGEGEAWVGASHVLFLIPRELGKAILPLPVSGRLMPADEREINRRPEDLGYWQLSTMDAYYYHMGNTLNDLVMQEMANLRKEKSPQVGTVQNEESSEMRRGVKGAMIKLLGWLMGKIPSLRKLFSRIYGFFFRLVEDY